MPTYFNVPVLGIGAPDYTDEIALGRARPGLGLKYNQTLKIFGVSFSALASPYAIVKTPIAPGGAKALVDWDTGQDMPFTVLAGYRKTWVSIEASCSQDYHIRTYMDGGFCMYHGIGGAGRIEYVAEVVGICTTMLDPTAASPHACLSEVYNAGTANLEGIVLMVAVLEKLGSPPLPDTKIVKCKFCGHNWEVHYQTTAIKCPKCGELNIYFSLRDIKAI